MSRLPNDSQILTISNTDDIQLVDAENNLLMQIKNVEGSWYDIPQSDIDDELDPKSISQFNHWFSSLPAVATAIAGNSSGLMTCSFDYSQLVQAKDGSGALGAVLKPGTTKIGAQARFQEAENLQSMVNANLVFNIASQILAQKHLADINERLQAIEMKVDAIQAFLQNSRFSKIETLRERLIVIGKLLSCGGKITKDTLQDLARKAQDIRGEVIHINSDITAAHTEIDRFDPASLFGSNALRDKLKQQIDNIERFQNEYFIGMQCLLIANLILFIKHDGNKEFILTSEMYLKELNDANGAIQKWERTKRTIARHLSKMKPLFERAASSQANALLVERRLKQADSLLYIDTAQITELNNRIQAAQSPQLMLEIVDGKVLQGRYLS